MGGEKNEKGVNFLHWTIWGPPLKIKILKIGLRHVLSWPKLSLEPKFHDYGTCFTFFALDRLGAPKKKTKTNKHNKLPKNFFYKGDPPKKWEFFKKIFFLHLL